MYPILVQVKVPVEAHAEERVQALGVVLEVVRGRGLVLITISAAGAVTAQATSQAKGMEAVKPLGLGQARPLVLVVGEAAVPAPEMVTLRGGDPVNAQQTTRWLWCSLG